MHININQTNFLIDLFDKYREKIYLYMRRDGYEINDILSFINGYTIIVEYCYRYSMNNIMGSGYDPISSFKTPVFSKCTEMIATIDNIANDINKSLNQCNQWEEIGIKYAVCLAKFYIKHVLFGNDNEVAEGDFLYVELPDRDEPELYDWVYYGYDYDI